MSTLPTFKNEKEFWKNGYKIVAGIDEVGRGAFAGPVVTGCVIFYNDFRHEKNIPVTINDSKKLSPKKRELADIWIKDNVLSYGIGKASVSEINKHGIVKATNIAFRRAIKAANVKIDYLLIDAFYVPYVKGIKHEKQRPIIKGDNVSLTIAAASILAKVYRDDLMRSLSKNPKYKKYQWETNKGYGTLAHRLAIKKHGKTRLHRVSFLLKLS